MDANDVTLAQCTQMRDRLRAYVTYLHRVRTRMDRRGFPQTDELLRATDAAYDAARELTRKLHYLGCKSGVGRSTKPKAD
jgi:hypothetical protein